MSLYYYIQDNLDKLNWNYLSKNPNAIHLLEQHSNKINWSNLSRNPKPLFIKWRQNIYKFYFHLKYKSIFILYVLTPLYEKWPFRTKS